MGRLQYEDIQNAQDLKEEEVEVPEWGGSVLIRGLSRSEVRDSRTAATVAGDVSDEEAEIAMLELGVIDPKLDKEAWRQLWHSKGALPIERVTRALLRASGISPEQLKEAEATFRAEP